MEETLDQLSPILPMDFFSVSYELLSGEAKAKTEPLKKGHLFPDFSPFLYEDSFAKVYGAWEREGLLFDVEVSKPFEECFFPEFYKGDSIEFFIDTRDLKTAGFLTRFCHHFVILPKPIDGVHAQEITVFRTEDRHELCDPQKIVVKGDFRSRSYLLKIFIPSECLQGYDPLIFSRLGFAYRINRVGGKPQHFALASQYLQIESQPSLWSSMHLRKM